MKAIVYLFTVLAILAMSVCYVMMKWGSKSDERSLEVESTVVSIGDEAIQNGGQFALATTRCHNLGCDIISILDVQVGCSCLKVKAPSVLKVDEVGILVFTMDRWSPDSGLKIPVRIVWQNGDGKHDSILYVESKFSIGNSKVESQGVVELGTVRPQSKLTRNVPVLLPNEPESQLIVEVLPKDSWLSAKFVEEPLGTKYLQLYGEVPPQLGHFESQVLLRSKTISAQQRRIVVTGNVLGSCRAHPTHLLRFLDESSNPVTARVTVTTSESESQIVDLSVEIEPALGPAPRVKITTQSLRTERSIDVTYPDENRAVENAKGRIAISLLIENGNSTPSREEILIPYHIYRNM